jgi:hypothetical protein
VTMQLFLPIAECEKRILALAKRRLKHDDW